MTEPKVTAVLVDDAPDVRALVRTRLKLSGRFDVVGEGSTGEEALRLARDLAPQILLLDVSMPDMDGLEALERIRQEAPDTLVAMFSGFEEHGLADRARAMGAVDFIAKSVPIDLLADRLLAALAGADPPPAPRSPSDTEPILQEHLERFRAAFDQAAIGMATLTLTGRIVRANEALAEIPEVAAEQLVGVPYADLVGDAERSAFVDVVNEIAAGRRDVVSLEHDLRSRRVVTTVAVVRDSERAPLYLFLQAQDVTEQRVAEAELLRSEEQFRLLVEGVGDYAIFMLDANGTSSVGTSVPSEPRATSPRKCSAATSASSIRRTRSSGSTRSTSCASRRRRVATRKKAGAFAKTARCSGPTSSSLPCATA